MGMNNFLQQQQPNKIRTAFDILKICARIECKHELLDISSYLIYFFLYFLCIFGCPTYFTTVPKPIGTYTHNFLQIKKLNSYLPKNFYFSQNFYFPWNFEDISLQNIFRIIHNKTYQALLPNITWQHI